MNFHRLRDFGNISLKNKGCQWYSKLVLRDELFAPVVEDNKDTGDIV